MSNPATTTDLEVRWRTLSNGETVNAEAFLDDAWVLLQGRRPTIAADVLAGTVSTSNVVRVICSMVLRVLKNPDGKSEERIDDYSYRRDAGVAAGALYVTADELGDLTPGGRSRYRSVRLVAYDDA